jgi:hypothetical protein
MIAVDTNLMVYAHRLDSVWNERAFECMRELTEGARSWALPWPCVHEFLAIVTHPRIWDPPTPLPTAIEQVSAWLESPSVVVLAEGGPYWRELQRLLAAGRIQGGRVHDARVAALCVVHGVQELWTADRDLGRFPSLRIRNPLAA